VISRINGGEPSALTPLTKGRSHDHKIPRSSGANQSFDATLQVGIGGPERSPQCWQPVHSPEPGARLLTLGRTGILKPPTNCCPYEGFRSLLYFEAAGLLVRPFELSILDRRRSYAHLGSIPRRLRSYRFRAIATHCGGDDKSQESEKRRDRSRHRFISYGVHLQNGASRIGLRQSWRAQRRAQSEETIRSTTPPRPKKARVGGFAITWPTVSEVGSILVGADDFPEGPRA
jgi:hypothetical protein